MHPDLDLQGVLQAAYRHDLQSQAEKERLLKRAAQKTRGTASATRPIKRLLGRVQPKPEQATLKFGEVAR